MKIIKQTQLNAKQKEQVVALWNNEYPEKLRYKSIGDFENYLNNLNTPIHYLLIDPKENPKGWAAIFSRENEKWFALILSEELHGKGIGTQMLNKLKEDEHMLNGWVIDHDSDKK